MKVRLKKLRDQVIVLTGASSGIGLVTARIAAPPVSAAEECIRAPLRIGPPLSRKAAKAWHPASRPC
jgi:NAD(P)-dependent dehydrogenase (short-subunit alcohol dehydrogenase family)